jgi:hypothetical protein
LQSVGADPEKIAEMIRGGARSSLAEIERLQKGIGRRGLGEPGPHSRNWTPRASARTISTSMAADIDRGTAETLPRRASSEIDRETRSLLQGNVRPGRTAFRPALPGRSSARRPGAPADARRRSSSTPDPGRWRNRRASATRRSTCSRAGEKGADRRCRWCSRSSS